MDIRYQRGKIYTIRNLEDDSKIYVGSTIETLSSRLTKHRWSSKIDKYKNNILYQSVNGDWINWYIELYENHPCNSKEELEKREGQVIREIGSLNKVIAGRTKKVYIEDNKTKLAQQQKQYMNNNKEKIQEYMKKYMKQYNEKITCDCGCEVRKNGLKRHKKTPKHLQLLDSIF
tara:strand:- start:53 stop:574 length:522 start_codon:yes stop_codon:yes gene_type:complete